MAKLQDKLTSDSSLVVTGKLPTGLRCNLCVCVCERERERERVFVCMCVQKRQVLRQQWETWPMEDLKL